MLTHRPVNLDRGDIALVTVATCVRPGLPAFLESCVRAGWAPRLLGHGRQWAGWSMKLHLANRLAEAMDEKYIMCLDGFDSLVIDGPVEALTKFLSFDSPLVISAQMGCWPDADKESSYPPSPTRYRTVNAGGWIAEKHYLRGLFRRVGLPPREYDDQRWWTDLFLRDNSIAALDYHQVLFGTCGQTFLEQRDGRIFNRETGTYPGVVHGNGGLELSVVAGWLGLGGWRVS